MRTWFECKVRYEKVLANGTKKKVNEPYLVNAMSFTEAEARIIEEIRPYIGGDFSVIALKKELIHEVFLSGREQDCIWFKIRVAFIALNEKTNEEKKSLHNILVKSCSTAEAEQYLHECMKDTMADYVVKSVTETNISEVFFFHREGVTDENR